MNFTHQNHLQYTIGDRLFGNRETSIEKFKVSVGQVDAERYAQSNYVDELHRTADLIRSDLGKDLVVFFSGGTDSEIVLRNFLKVGLRPRCVIIKFKDNYNAADVRNAQLIAHELRVRLEMLDFDVLDFHNSGECKEFGEALQCTQLTYLMVYKHVLQLGLPAVMGGEVLLTRQVNKDDSYWYYTFRENEDASAMRFSLKYNVPLVNEYFSYTPELLLYYLENPDIKRLVSNRYNYKLTSVSSKNAILQKLYPEIMVKKKTHGFESLLAFNYEAYKHNGQDQIKRLEFSLDGIQYDDTIKQLKGRYENN